MSNLRDLIHYADLAEFESVVGAASSVCANINYGSNYVQWKKYGGGNNAVGSRQCWNTCHLKEPPASGFSGDPSDHVWTVRSVFASDSAAIWCESSGIYLPGEKE